MQAARGSIQENVNIRTHSAERVISRNYLYGNYEKTFVICPKKLCWH